MAFADFDGGAQAQVGTAFHHQQGDGAVALDLKHQRAIEFDVGGKQGGRGDQFAQQVGNGGRIVMVGLDGLPGRVQAHGLDADAAVFGKIFFQLIGHGGNLSRSGGPIPASPAGLRAPPGGLRPSV
ncbi:hypothetical protein D3C78_1652260 [compost metagenome]